MAVKANNIINQNIQTTYHIDNKLKKKKKMKEKKQKKMNTQIFISIIQII